MTPAIDLDTELMLRVQCEDAESFGVLLNRNRNVVIQYLARMVQNQSIAEELAQDVFIRVYRSRQKYEPTARFSTWLYRITTNVALNHFRDSKRSQQTVSLDIVDSEQVRREARDAAPLVEEQLVKDVLAHEVRRAIRSLPAKQRAAVVMHKYQEMDYAQISAVLRCSPSAVKALMFRAYETLRGRLAYLQESR
ncbi:MAG TPA: RNA polymerase sigma factor [Bryobacteraceae bacterium]|jgi:RNA polymerase sigma-70 factor (ECF subfamily)|nr:RNA polymerase sigma factor [Bryobacteraceae bacterium]